MLALSAAGVSSGSTRYLPELQDLKALHKEKCKVQLEFGQVVPCLATRLLRMLSRLFGRVTTDLWGHSRVERRELKPCRFLTLLLLEISSC